jgi:hypothetical protein
MALGMWTAGESVIRLMVSQLRGYEICLSYEKSNINYKCLGEYLDLKEMNEEQFKKLQIKELGK